MKSLPTKRFKIIIPYRGSEHSVVVSVSELKSGYLTVQLPDGTVATIETNDLDLLVRCGLAQEMP